MRNTRFSSNIYKMRNHTEKKECFFMSRGIMGSRKVKESIMGIAISSVCIVCTASQCKMK